MATNIKAKIIIGGAALLLTGFAATIIVNGVRRRNISKKIFEILNDTSLLGSGATVGANEVHKYTHALDPKFWKKTSGSPLPSKLITDAKAREIAREINDGVGTVWDNESGILSAIKKTSTQGQLSQVANQYSIQHGNLADDLEKALSGGVILKDRLAELNNYINSLPY